MLCYKHYCVWNRDLSIHWRLCITSDHWMSHVMRLKSVFGSTVFRMPLIRDIWFVYSCVSSSSWTFLFVLFHVFCNVFILLHPVCMFFLCGAFVRNKQWHFQDRTGQLAQDQQKHVSLTTVSPLLPPVHPVVCYSAVFQVLNKQVQVQVPVLS